MFLSIFVFRCYCCWGCRKLSPWKDLFVLVGVKLHNVGGDLRTTITKMTKSIFLPPALNHPLTRTPPLPAPDESAQYDGWKWATHFPIGSTTGLTFLDRNRPNPTGAQA